MKFIVVTIDYFTKWAEEKPLATIMVKNITKFLWKNIVCRFRIPHSIILDNEKQFDSEYYWEWCAELRIQVKYSSSEYPQANRQVEATSKSLLGILKKKLMDQKLEWAEELPGVLWFYKTTVKTTTRETPYALAYESEAVALVEVRLPTYRTHHFNLPQNDRALEEHLDLLDEEREEDEIKTILNKRKTELYFNKRVKPKTFKVGDLVLKKTWVTT